MSPFITFVLIAIVIIFIILYRRNSNESVYKFIVRQGKGIYDKYAPFSYKTIREKVKDLGQDFTPRQYAIQVAVFSIGAGVISYLYFYNLLLCIVYIVVEIIKLMEKVSVFLFRYIVLFIKFI